MIDEEKKDGNGKPLSSMLVPMMLYVIWLSGVAYPSKLYTRLNLLELWKKAIEAGQEFIAIEVGIIRVADIIAIVDDAKRETAQDIFQSQYKSFDLTVPDGELVVPISTRISKLGGKG